MKLLNMLTDRHWRRAVVTGVAAALLALGLATPVLAAEADEADTEAVPAVTEAEAAPDTGATGATGAEDMGAGDEGPDGEIAVIAAGGRLYDDWMRALGERQPKDRHPLYPPEGLHAGDPGMTWRCVVCHGWDYRGVDGAFRSGPVYTGIKGVDGMASRPVEEIVAVIGNGNHGYANYLDDQSLNELALFVSKGLVDVDQVIEPVTRRARAEPGASSIFFSTICTNCHGRDGGKMETIPPLGDVARADPWQSLHKMLNGHPGDDMPALRAFDMRAILGVLAYIQTLPPADPLASIARGGKLYDDWAKELKVPYPADRHPALPEKAKIADGSNSWRCVECHGWDYKGANGIRGIGNLAGAYPTVIMKILDDDTHAMSRLLSHRDKMDLANFISRGQVEVNEFIDPATGKARGDAEADTRFFLTLCAACHGDTGTEIRTMPAMGRVANENPAKALHKMLHGHPGDNMPAWQVTLPLPTIKNLLAKLQALPTRKRI